MSAELSKCYELLGVKPGVSVAELKAAYRDMARVWHPDRFAHDERLQKKAQEKLKEINEAYEQLISGKIPRPQPDSTRREQRRDNSGFDSAKSYTPSRSSLSFPWQWVVVPLLIFGSVFFVISKSLLRQQAQSGTDPNEQQMQQRAREAAPSAAEVSRSANEQRTRDRADSESQTEEKNEAATTQPATAPVQPITTVTVLIDPSTGLLARAECPTKTRMTYPAGNEPHGYCNASHPAKAQAQADGAQPNNSRVKSFAKRVASPGKWLGAGSKEKSEDEKRD